MLIKDLIERWINWISPQWEFLPQEVGARDILLANNQKYKVECRPKLGEKKDDQIWNPIATNLLMTWNFYWKISHIVW